MPLSAAVSADFSKGTVGQTVATPTGASLVGTAPVYVSDGASGTRARFTSSAAAAYFRPTFTADSDFGQLTVDFVIPSGGTPTSNKETFLLAGSGAILASGLVTTARALWTRDGSSSGSGITGWTVPTLVEGVEYRFQTAIIKGSSTTTGSMKVQLTRKSDGVVLASGLTDGTSNTGTVQTNGAIVGLRTAAGNATLDITMYRVSNQAFDYLGDIPPATAAETPVSADDGVAFIGDSTTDRSGAGAAQVKTSILNNGQAFVSARVQVNGLTSRTINYDNNVHPTAYEQVDVFRNASYDPGTWVFAVGGNGGASDLAQQQTWLNQLLAKVAEGPRAGYRVVLTGFARQDPVNADAARFWQAIQAITPPSKITLTRFDYNSALHNGRSETGLWQSTSPTEAHMTASGYTLRDSLIAPQILKTTGAAVAKTPQVAVSDPVTLVSTSAPKTPQVAVSDPVTLTTAAVTKTPQVSVSDPVTLTTATVTKTPQVSVSAPATLVAAAVTKTPQVAVSDPATLAAIATSVVPKFIGWGIQLVLKPFDVVTPPATSDGSVYSDTYSDTY